jgi:hypothetical protein
MLELTPEQEVKRNFDAAMDSVRLLKAGKPADMEEAEWTDTVKRNVEHLEIQIAKGDYYAGHDLTPFTEVINK